jgi:hypothetical protein
MDPGVSGDGTGDGMAPGYGSRPLCAVARWIPTEVNPKKSAETATARLIASLLNNGGTQESEMLPMLALRRAVPGIEPGARRPVGLE